MVKGGSIEISRVPVQPPVNADDLRRSGRIAIWPYVMRELPLSPVEALRFERQSDTAGESHSDKKTKDSTSILHRGFVQYFPARLVDERGKGRAKRTENEQRHHGPRVDSDLDSCAAKLAEVQRRQQDTRHRGREACWEGTRRKTRSSSPYQHVESLSRRRPVSSGYRRRSLDFIAGGATRIEHRAIGDCAECPLGCGGEVRLRDLVHHQTSLCDFRYVDCLVPGCGRLVQASKMDVHLKRECSARKMQCSLAAKAEMAKLETQCDACGSLVPRKKLRSHHASDCGMRLMTCRRPDCAQQVPAQSLAKHERYECAIVKRNDAFVEQAARKPTTVECPECGFVVPTGLFRKHAADECRMRIVACPNKNMGCNDELFASAIKRHLRQECFVQIDRTERASRHVERLERIRCSGCGYTVIAQRLIKHQRDMCPNRKAPCKHWELGCPTMLRLSAMDEHLCVDRLLDARSCLAFDSGKAYIALGEEDRKPPWTVEMWIWRPGLVESTREKARMALKAYWEFQQSRDKLAVSKRRLAMLEPLLAAAATRSSKEKSREAEQAREKLMDEMVDAATLRDDAKVGLVVASVVLSNTLAAATRGVEELTVQDRLRGFDRLALGSTPWYAMAPDMRSGNAGGRCRDHEEGDDTAKQQVVSLQSYSTSELSQTLDGRAPMDSRHDHTESGIVGATIRTGKSVDEETTLTQDEKSQPSNPNAQDMNEAPLSAADMVDGGDVGELATNEGEPLLDGGTENRPASDGLQSNAISNGKQEKVETTVVADEQPSSLDATQVATEVALGQKEASFWAEWVALNGPSLAKRLLRLSGDTLPQLKEEVVAVTGLAVDSIFRASGDVSKTDNFIGDEEVIAAEGGAINDGSILSTNMSVKRSATRKAAKKAKRKQKHEQQFGKKLETRIAEEVGKRGGVETLFGSNNVLFQLEMGPQDRMGIKTSGKPDQPFNYRCPRERWVHLAFVSDSTGVFLLENGKTASRLRDVTVPLPMREIGGRETACQCLIQDVRYWKVKRSKDELAGLMHEVLPTSAIEDGLLGYWTFEEGAGDYVNDVTEQRFRARKVGRGLKWVRPEMMCTFQVAEAPTPSWREQNVCKVELRRARLAGRGRLHRQFVPCPAGCGDSLLQKTVQAHLAYRCKLRTVTCSMAACGKRVLAKYLGRHLQEYCASYKAWLRMAQAGHAKQETSACPHCSETLRKCNLEVHIKYVCQWAKDPCRNLGCGASIPRLRLPEHERRFCGASSAVRKRRRLARARARSKYDRQWAQDGE